MKIVLHAAGCPGLTGDGLQVKVKAMDDLVSEVYTLMQTHQIPFYHVVIHSRECPGGNFPLEELEHRLFVLER